METVDVVSVEIVNKVLDKEIRGTILGDCSVVNVVLDLISANRDDMRSTHYGAQD